MKGQILFSYVHLHVTVSFKECNDKENDNKSLYINIKLCFDKVLVSFTLSCLLSILC